MLFGHLIRRLSGARIGDRNRDTAGLLTAGERLGLPSTDTPLRRAGSAWPQAAHFFVPVHRHRVGLEEAETHRALEILIVPTFVGIWHERDVLRRRATERHRLRKALLPDRARNADLVDERKLQLGLYEFCLGPRAR